MFKRDLTHNQRQFRSFFEDEWEQQWSLAPKDSFVCQGWLHPMVEGTCILRKSEVEVEGLPSESSK